MNSIALLAEVVTIRGESLVSFIITLVVLIVINALLSLTGHPIVAW